MTLRHRRRMATRQMNVPWLTLRVTRAGVVKTYHFCKPRKWWDTGPYFPMGQIIHHRLQSPPDRIEQDPDWELYDR